MPLRGHSHISTTGIPTLAHLHLLSITEVGSCSHQSRRKARRPARERPRRPGSAKARPCLWPGRYLTVVVTSARDPYARQPRTPSPAGGRIIAGHASRGASRPQEPRPTGPPRGSGAARPQGALRAIDPSAWPHSWRACGPRRLRRQFELLPVATQRGAARGHLGARPRALRWCREGGRLTVPAVRAAGVDASAGSR
jgi:hypothetical protein